ncbi:MAG: accessory factor UbiK family protein [Gammaproteobacteria bacterium]|nr:MAG: accessory factor UbiK family protein [Gammaproteobacteria bacterium]
MISQLAQRLSQELQEALPIIGNLIPKRELHIALQSTLSKLNLVTREEFDAQSAVLQRTREKLEALELLCAEIEQQLSDKQ